MEYYKLVAVTGLPGLYELISSKKDGAIVRSLQDKTTRFASTRIHQFSHLESIEIYTTGENVNLVEIFSAMQTNSEASPDAKDDKAVKEYFQKVYPSMDFDRVYNSDMKKIVKWFDILKKNAIDIKLSEPDAEENDVALTDAPQENTEKPADDKAVENEETSAATPKKATAKKKAPAKKKAE